jgi:hypothetical protein
MSSLAAGAGGDFCDRLGNPKARQKHEVNGGKRDWVLAVPFGDARRLAKLLDLGDARATLLFLPGEFTHALCRV